MSGKKKQEMEEALVAWDQNMGIYTKSQLDEAVDNFGDGFVSSGSTGTIPRPTKNASAQYRIFKIIFDFIKIFM